MKILNILSSINAENSNTAKLVKAINEKIISAHPEGELLTRDLAKNQVPHLEAAHFSAFNSSADSLTDDDAANLFHSDQAISELFDADIIVIAVPFYNFNIPGTLKSWIDQIVRSGVTFSYSSEGPKGLLTNKKVYLAFASGAIYSEGAWKNLDFAEPYLRTILGFIGLTDITTFRMEGVKVPGVKETAFETATNQIAEHQF